MSPQWSLQLWGHPISKIISAHYSCNSAIILIELVTSELVSLWAGRQLLGFTGSNARSFCLFRNCLRFIGHHQDWYPITDLTTSGRVIYYNNKAKKSIAPCSWLCKVEPRQASRLLAYLFKCANLSSQFLIVSLKTLKHLSRINFSITVTTN